MSRWNRRGATACVAVALAVAACSSPTDNPELQSEIGPGADTPLQAVENVVDAIDQGDFPAAGIYAVTDQAALAALAEGASFPDVAEALRDNDPEIAANFWSGFAQGAGSFLTGDVSFSDGDESTSEGVQFEAVRLIPADGSERIVWTRDVDGYRVDLFASFGAGLGDKMIGPVERLLAAQTDDTKLVLARLRNVVPSLYVAADTPGVSAETRQQILALVELITRVG